jgi:nitrite reductase/ring-hydroxylating ferredoxin subunit
MQVRVAHAADIADGERKIVQVGSLSIGVFHHAGKWYALRNSCLHRGGPVCTGTLVGDTLTCPWHGFEYDVTTGQMLADPRARLDSYPVFIEGEDIVLQVPETFALSSSSPAATTPTSQPEVKTETPASVSVKRELADNEFFISDVPPGKIGLAEVDDEEVAVYNVSGTFCATYNACPHAEGPLNQGTLAGSIVTCPWHGSQFDVCTGKVVRGPAKEDVRIYRVTIEGEIGRVEAE